jgi:cellulose biosynthesis protein BcsQ
MNICVASLEPGSGKSTLALNLACALARQAPSVLLVEGDAPVARQIPLSEEGTVHDAAGTLVLRASAVPNLHVLCGAGRALAAGEDPARLQERIRTITGRFPFAVLDTPSRDGAAVERMLPVADGILVPLQPERRAAESAAALLGRAMEQRPGIEFLGFVPMAVGALAGSDPEGQRLFDRLVAEFGARVMVATIPHVPEFAGAEGSCAFREGFPSAEVQHRFSELAARLRLGPVRSAPLSLEATVLDATVADASAPMPKAPPAAAPAAAAPASLAGRIIAWFRRLLA